MSSDQPTLAVAATGLGKSYKIFRRPEDQLKDLLFGKWRRYHTDHWALRGVYLAIPKGTTLGIVCRNGSGKSTLLQMICGTLQSTEGSLKVNGRIAALLELGAGFNPHFTGRENVYMNATILGLDKATIAERFDSIAQFAEIGEFIEAPVKTYSSGMFARLAFAVAISVDPDILVVDEILAVGDEGFQRRCFNRIEQIRENGATILFVSHSPGTIIDLCDTAILLDQGELLMVGDPKKVVAEYQKLIYAPPEQAAALRSALARGEAAGELPAPGDAPAAAEAEALPRNEDYFEPTLVSRSAVSHASNGARIVEIRLVAEDSRRVNVLLPDRVYQLQMKVTFERPAYRVRFGMHIKTVTGFGLGGLVSHPTGAGVPFVEAGTTLWASFAVHPRLTHNSYFIDVSVHAGGPSGGEELMHMIADADIFRIDRVPQDVASGFVRFGAEDYFSYRVGDLEGEPASDPKAVATEKPIE